MPVDNPRQIAFYGKGGIGKSTVASNLSAWLNAHGKRVLHVGCDPKHDSSRPFLRGQEPVTIVELMRQADGANPSPEQFLMETESGVHCIEVGGPRPGVGCAGLGILKMFEYLEEGKVLHRGYDAVLYDVLGDVVCGGFAAPMRAGYAKEICVVVSGEFMALYAANNICRGVANYASRQEVRLAGVVLNSRNVPRELEVAEAFAARVGSEVIGVIPRDPVVPEAELKKQTAVELFPDSAPAKAYRALGETILAGTTLAIPQPLEDRELEELYFSIVYREG